MKYKQSNEYDITNSHQHLFESASSNSFTTIKNNQTNCENLSDIDLTLIGYSSNLYRDDLNASKLESMLIPWNGDENLLIDRFFFYLI